MPLHRFYLPPQPRREGLLRLDGAEAHHAARVLRLKADDETIVLDGAGSEFFCVVKNVSRDSLLLEITKHRLIPPPPCSITLFVGIPKGKIIENIIQKAVELGARKIVPLLTERVVTRLDEEDAAHKRAIWQQVAIEAMKQCGAPRLPEIELPASVGHCLNQLEKPELQWVGSLQSERRHPGEIIREFEAAAGHSPSSAGVWIGPEGDFTPGELQAITGFGAHPISLGGLVLRVETAAIFCLSILNYEFNTTCPTNET